MKKFISTSVSILFGVIAMTGITFAQTNSTEIEMIPTSIGTVIKLEDMLSPAKYEIFPSIASDEEKKKLLIGQKNPVNLFLVRTQQGDILIDTGWGNDGTVKGRAGYLMQKLGINPHEIVAVLLTHMHVDHISGLLKNGAAAFPNAKLIISKPEWDYWTVKGEGNPSNVSLARAVAAAYSGKVSLFDGDEEVWPGIRAEAAPGHTVGHVIFSVGKGEQSLTIVGDLVHAAALQLQYPVISPVYDTDPIAGAATRQKLLNRLADEGRHIAGMHIRKHGRLVKTPDGGFTMTNWK